MTLDIEALKSGIREFNSSRDQYCLADFALHQVFAGELTETTVPLRVLSVNYFYYANVDKERGALLAECERIINNLDVVRNAVQLISRLELPCQEEAERTIRRSAIKILPVVVRGREGGRFNYSFATKFLHWSAPRVFPIVDNLAPKTLKRLGEPSVWTPGVNGSTTTDKRTEEYGKVISLYNRLLGVCPRNNVLSDMRH